jgi:phosphocarrier protein
MEKSSVVKQEVVVTNKTGLHARPASMFVETAGKYSSDIKVVKDSQEINGKSIMGLMSLGINQSTEITIQAEGEDADQAVEALVGLVEDKFGE